MEKKNKNTWITVKLKYFLINKWTDRVMLFDPYVWFLTITDGSAVKL